MPMTSGTRMLRARRKDCNIKPNRRLDRKSSRGMLYENEELRMRTITINAEVEQGQHALKKLRRENEQLRREMWCLRDEYDKMEKLLREKESDEDTDRENSESDGNVGNTDDSEDEKLAIKQIEEQQEENPDFENEENLQKSSNFGNETNVRTFDGLSVIDEQTEETQTTESPLGYGASSRGNSANRTFSPPAEMYDEACGISVSEMPQFGCTATVYGPGKFPPKKRSQCLYENNGEAFIGNWNADCETYETRPASPYPFNGSLHDSYQKRYQVLQNLSMVPITPTGAMGNSEWIFSDPTKTTSESQALYNPFEGEVTNFILDKSEIDTKTNSLYSPSTFGYDLFQDRTGPDVFVTDGLPETLNKSPLSLRSGKEKLTEKNDSLMDNLTGRLDKVEISQDIEKNSKSNDTTGLTKLALSREVVGGRGESGRLPKAPKDSQETSSLGKLTIDEAVGENDKEISKRVQPLVSCQNLTDQDVREKNKSTGETDLKVEEMSQPKKPQSSKYQTKITVTLKTPPTKMETKIPPKQLSTMSPTLSPRNYHDKIRCGIKPEYSMRFQTFPNTGFQQVNSRLPAVNGTDCLVNHFAGVRTHPNGLSGSLPRLPGLAPKTDIVSNTSYIPLTDLEKGLDVLPGEDSIPVPIAQQLIKPVKIPPAPPPRTSSCPKAIIPASLLGVKAMNQTTFKKGKPFLSSMDQHTQLDPIMYNPLLLSQPIATSSPTISFRATKYGPNSSSENLCLPRFQKQNCYDESSNEDLSKQKLKFRDELNLGGMQKLNKSLSSPSFGNFRTLRRKRSDPLAASVENIITPRVSEVMVLPEKRDKGSKNQVQSNVSVSSSSGLDMPILSDQRKGKVSIQFKKKQSQRDGKRAEESGGDKKKDSTTSRRNSSAQKTAIIKACDRHKLKSNNDETDVTTSERERKNSVSSRTSSLAAGSTSRRKFSTSSNRTYLNEEKIPWCGCWGNGCI